MALGKAKGEEHGTKEGAAHEGLKNAKIRGKPQQESD